MLFETPAGQVPLAPTPIVNSPAAQAQVATASPLPFIYAVPAADPSKAITPRNESSPQAQQATRKTKEQATAQTSTQTPVRTAFFDNSIFFAQLIGKPANDDSSASNEPDIHAFAAATKAYNNLSTPANDFLLTLSPERLDEFSETKYRPLKPPVDSGRLSVLI